MCGRRACIGSGFRIDDQALAERAALARSGISAPMRLARSRRASAPSPKRYAHSGVGAVARNVTQRDPAARRKC
ncbi:hypothetical protein GCM10010421_05610 [Streptomyces glaucus]|uniref:Uncharacterized protein n=1 Tax=Streptomyces glaucus TaxID=284029 RepID=A0ABN3J751_9ACTN